MLSFVAICASTYVLIALAEAIVSSELDTELISVSNTPDFRSATSMFEILFPVPSTSNVLFVNVVVELPVMKELKSGPVIVTVSPDTAVVMFVPPAILMLSLSFALNVTPDESSPTIVKLESVMKPAPFVNWLLLLGIVGVPERSEYAPDVATAFNPRLVAAFVFCVEVNPWLLTSILNLLPNAVEVVVAKLASSPNAAASSFNVFKALGAESTTPATSASTYALTDCCDGTCVAEFEAILSSSTMAFDILASALALVKYRLLDPSLTVSVLPCVYVRAPVELL